MCGLIGFVSANPKQIEKTQFYSNLSRLFDRMQDKGGSVNNTDGCGWYHPHMGVVKGNLTAKEAIKGELFEQMTQLPVPTIFIGHTRKTTRGDSEHNENNHPLWSDNWILVHNGSVDSDDVKANDYNLPGKVDSNLILAAIEKYGIEKWTDHIKGVAAVIIAKRNDPNNLWIYKETRPMFVYRAEYGIWIASTAEALEEIASDEAEEVSMDEIFPGFYPIHAIKDHRMYNLHINMKKKEWKSTYLLTKALPEIKYDIKGWRAKDDDWTNNHTKLYTKLGATATPVEVAEMFEAKKWTTNFHSVCPTCAGRLGLDHSKGSTTSICCSHCGTKVNVKSVQSPTISVVWYPMKYHMTTPDVITPGVLNAFLTKDENVLVQYDEFINVLKIRDTLYVFLTSLQADDTMLQISFSANSSRMVQLKDVKFPPTNNYITDKKDYFRRANGKFYVGLVPANRDDFGILATQVYHEYEDTFLSH